MLGAFDCHLLVLPFIVNFLCVRAYTCCVNHIQFVYDKYKTSKWGTCNERTEIFRNRNAKDIHVSYSAYNKPILNYVEFKDSNIYSFHNPQRVMPDEYINKRIVATLTRKVCKKRHLMDRKLYLTKIAY